MRLLLVGLGGGLGSICRYLTGVAILSVWPSSLPAGTLVVNVLGCLAVGLVSVLAQRSPPALSPDAWALAVTGFLGGFTTFSAFGLETASLFDTERRLAFLNVALHLGVAIGAVFAGRAAGRALFL